MQDSQRSRTLLAAAIPHLAGSMAGMWDEAQRGLATLEREAPEAAHTMRAEMAAAVKNLDFETAALIRDELYALTGEGKKKRK